MNILLINWRCIKNPEAGGAEVHMHEIFKRIVGMGHQVTLVAHHYKNAPRTEQIDGIKVLRVGNKYLFAQQFKKYYLKKLAKQNFDLVVDDISKIPLNTPDYIKKPLVAIIHHLHGKTLYKELFFPLAYYINQREKNIPKHYGKTIIFAVSPSTRKELIELGQPADKVELLYNGINHELFDKCLHPKSATPLITYVGRIKKYKNIEMIIDVMPELLKTFPDLKLEIGGKGDYTESLINYIASKNLSDRVVFHGFVDDQDKAEVMGRAWLFATMAQKEGWGITVIEANAAGTLVVGSDVPGLRDSIVDGETGVLVPYDDRQELVKTLTKLIEDKERREKLSKQALKWSKKYDWQKSAEDFIETVKKQKVRCTN